MRVYSVILATKGTDPDRARKSQPRAPPCLGGLPQTACRCGCKPEMLWAKNQQFGPSDGCEISKTASAYTARAETPICGPFAPVCQPLFPWRKPAKPCGRVNLQQMQRTLRRFMARQSLTRPEGLAASSRPKPRQSRGAAWVTALAHLLRAASRAASLPCGAWLVLTGSGGSGWP